ncbi:MAG: hypothetical protein RML12_04005 [Xanthomonadales bacterium]|nr:hypothetical protein [Xanthomonadales bacterium]
MSVIILDRRARRAGLRVRVLAALLAATAPPGLPAQVIPNGGFESGLAGWTVGGTGRVAAIQGSDITGGSFSAFQGSFFAALSTGPGNAGGGAVRIDGNTTDEFDAATLAVTVNIPFRPAVLAFEWSFASSEQDQAAQYDDLFDVMIYQGTPPTDPTTTGRVFSGSSPRNSGTSISNFPDTHILGTTVVNWSITGAGSAPITGTQLRFGIPALASRLRADPPAGHCAALHPHHPLPGRGPGRQRLRFGAVPRPGGDPRRLRRHAPVAGDPDHPDRGRAGRGQGRGADPAHDHPDPGRGRSERDGAGGGLERQPRRNQPEPRGPGLRARRARRLAAGDAAADAPRRVDPGARLLGRGQRGAGSLPRDRGPGRPHRQHRDLPLGPGHQHPDHDHGDERLPEPQPGDQPRRRRDRLRQRLHRARGGRGPPARAGVGGRCHERSRPTSSPRAQPPSAACTARNPWLNHHADSGGRDGRYVVYEANCNHGGGNADGNFEIFRFNRATNVRRQITSSTNPVTNFSPQIDRDDNGRNVYFLSNGNYAGTNAAGAVQLFRFQCDNDANCPSFSGGVNGFFQWTQLNPAAHLLYGFRVPFEPAAGSTATVTRFAFERIELASGITQVGYQAGTSSAAEQILALQNGVLALGAGFDAGVPVVQFITAGDLINQNADLNNELYSVRVE